MLIGTGPVGVTSLGVFQSLSLSLGHFCLHPPGSCAFANYHLIAPDIYRKLFQRPWWRPGDVPPVQIEVPIVASAPDMAEVGSVLDDASEVRADRSKGPEVSRWSPH